MVVWSEQPEAASVVTKRGRVRQRLAALSVIATLMLLVGLVSPVAAAAPDAPTGPAIAQPAALTATVTWTAAATGDPATGFDISITPAVAGAPSTNVTSPVTISGLAPGTTYSVSVVATNLDGPSAPLTRSFTTHSVPNAPTIGTAARVGQTSSVSVPWTASTNNGGTAITDYEVRVDGTGAWASAGTTSPVQVDNLAVGPHSFEIRARNAVGVSVPSAVSNQVTIPPAATVPGAPTIGAAARVGSTSSATVAWTAPANDGGSAITTYQIDVDGANTWAISDPTSPATVPGLAVGAHTFRVRAVNAVGSGAASAASNQVTIPPAATVPGAPTIGAASNAGPSSATVVWTAPADDGGSAITTYQIDVDGANTWAIADPTSPATVSGLAAGPHTFRVRAVNAVGPGAPSVASNTITATLPASAVQNVTATVDSANTVTITWDPPTNTGGGVGQYLVSLSPAEAGPTTVSASTFETSYSGLPGGNYTVSVVAVNAAGNGVAGTDTFTIVVAPGSPLNVKTTATSTTNGTATVTWDPPANNGNGTISEYVVKLGGKTVTVPAASPRTAGFTGLPIGKLTATVQARNAQGLSAAGSSPEFFSKRVVHPFATREAFVRQAFRDLFDVNPTAAEVATFAQATAADGANAPAVITSLMQSQRFETRRQVSRLYFAYFLRVPDAAGQNYWADLMDRGVLDLQGVSDEFARSPEFINTYGGLNEPEFLVVVYNNVLLRTPDIGGFNYWLGERNKGLTRGGVMTWFTEGREFISLSLPAIDTSLAHITLLDRSPSSGEYALWFNRINNSSDSLETLVASIWASDEYAARVNPN